MSCLTFQFFTLSNTWRQQQRHDTLMTLISACLVETSLYSTSLTSWYRTYFFCRVSSEIWRDRINFHLAVPIYKGYFPHWRYNPFKIFLLIIFIAFSDFQSLCFDDMYLVFFLLCILLDINQNLWKQPAVRFWLLISP